jgi:hypothetical protein
VDELAQQAASATWEYEKLKNQRGADGQQMKQSEVSEASKQDEQTRLGGQRRERADWNLDQIDCRLSICR